MKFFRDRHARRHETQHLDGQYHIREVQRLAHMRMSDFLKIAAHSKAPNDYERFQIMHRLEQALQHAKPYLTDEPQR